MPWEALPRIAFAVAIYPFQPSAPSDLPLELGDELYIIEQGGKDKSWYRGYLVAPPSLLAGLTSIKGQTLEARVFSGIFPKSCVEVREVLGDAAKEDDLLEEAEEDEEAEETSATNGLGTGSANDDGGPSQPNSVNSSKRDSQRSRHAMKKGAGQDQSLSKRISGIESLKKRKLARGPSNRSKGSQKSQKTLAVSKPRQRDPNAPRPPAPVPMLKIGDETPTSAQEPLVDEIASCLREWHSCHLHELLLSRQYPLLEKFSALVQEVDFSRRQLLHNVLTGHELKSLREKTVWDLVRGNKLLSDEVIVRDPLERGRMLTGDDSAVDMTRLQAMMSLLNNPPTQPPDAVSLHHLLVSVKTVNNTLLEPTTLVWHVCSKPAGGEPGPITEAYAAELPQSGATSTSGKLDQLKTLFTDLSAGDIGEGTVAEKELYLVVKVLVKQPLLESTSNGSAENIGTKDGTSGGRMDMLNGARSMSRQNGRRSLMWGQKSPSGSYWGKGSQQFGASIGSRNGPITEEDTTDVATPTSILKNGIPGNSDPKAKAFVERLVAVGVLRIGPLMRQDKELDQNISLWAPTMTVTGDQDREHGWDDTIQRLMQSRTNQFVRFKPVDNLQLHIKPFLSPDSESLIKNTPTLLQNITTTSKIGFSGAPTKARSDIYLTLNDAFLPRHALLSHPRNGSTAIPQSLASSHLQLTVEIRRASGERIENCIVPSSNRPATSKWSSLSVERGHNFDQTIRLAIPASDVPNCHVFMTLVDGPDSPFALAWMPLWDQQAFIRDGHHSLLLYKFDESTSVPSSTSSAKGGYLSLPWNSRGKDDVSKDEAVTGPVATLRMHSFLCSTQFSQDKVLLGLLKWKERPVGQLTELLQRVVFVPEIEIVKLLSEVFDALFGILVENAGSDEYEDLVFNALVTVLGIVHDRRFNLGPLVDQYAKNRFSYPFATPCLIRSFSRLLSNPTESESSRRLRATFKVGKHVLKFIINAREQQKVKEAGIGITNTQPTFTRDLQGIFKSLEALMTSSAPILVGSQTLAVQHFHTWLPELTGLLTTEEILHIAIDFVDACVDVKGKLILYKLILIINYSKLELFQLAETRRALTVNTVRWLAPHWGTTDFVTQQWRDQVRLCCSVLSTQVSELGVEVSDYIPKVVESYRAIQSTPRKEKDALSLLFPTAYPFLTKRAAGQPVFDEALIELAAVLAAMSCLPTGIHLDLQEAELSGFLSEALEVHMSIISGEAFPNNWLSVHVYHHKSTMQTLEHLAGILVDSFLPHPDDAENFNTELWRTFFTTLLKLVGSAALALETFPEQKRRAVWKIAGDVREHGADLLRRSWEAIGWETSPEDRRRYGLEKMGGYQVQYVPGLVAPIVELCLSVHEGLRSVAVEVLQTMIVSEWTLSQDLSVVQAEMIDCLDRLFKSKHLTESIQQKLFITDLTELFEPLSNIPNDALYAAFKDLVATIDEFLDLLAAVHSSDITGEAVHIMHTLRLMEFLRDMQKEDIFIRYVHQLAKVQMDTRNLVEAGLALKLHADLYSWDTAKTVDALSDPVYPEQSAFDRKELLYFEMIKYYEEGKSWDSALSAYRELAEQYETNVFDFAKLARTQRAMAKIYEGISKGERQTPRYFRVVYRGLGFPAGLRDREFIFEGSPSERMSAFTDRMQQQHTSARIVSSGEIEDLEGQFLQISGVAPHRDLSHPVYQRSKISQAMREHLLSAKPGHFSVTSRRHATAPDVREHFVEKIIYSTAESFPTILRRSEIVSSKEVKFSPIQSAIERTVRKTHELTGLEKKHVSGFDYDYGPFSDAINSSVDPHSSASVARYRELLPARDEGEDEDEDLDLENEDEPKLTPDENALRIALLDHALVLKRCIALFGDNPSNNQRIVFANQDFTDKLGISFAPELEALAPAFEAHESPSMPFSPIFELTPAMPTSPKVSSSIADITEVPPQTPSSRRQSRHEKNRLSLSFLKRGTSETSAADGSNSKTHHSASASGTTPITNGSLSAGGMSNTATSPGGGIFLDESGRGTIATDSNSRATTPRSRSKSANRRSWLGRRSSTDIAEEPLPHGSSSTSANPQRPPGTATTSRSRSSVFTGFRNDDRPVTGGSAAASISNATGRGSVTGNTSTVTAAAAAADKAPQSRAGSVKKRFSLLKLGGGGAKRGVKGVDAVAEE